MRLSPSIALLRTQPDERLVKLAREGSDPAFAAIVERHRRQVLQVCRRVLPEARAEDAAQQVFMSAWNALARGDDVQDVHAWLLRIARNTSLNALRVRGYDYDELRESLRVGEAPQAELERRDVVRQTLAGLAALPPRQREALLRNAVEGAPHSDIARDLGLSEGATRQLVLRARIALRSAASAVVPTPLITWAATAAQGGAGGEASTRIAEIAAGSGAAGSGALLAKAGTVAVIAGGALAGPAVVHHAAKRDEASADARPVAVAAHESAAHRQAAAKPAPTRAAPPVSHPAPVVRAPSRVEHPVGGRMPRSSSGEAGHRRSSGSDDRRSTSGSGDDGHRSTPTADHHSGSSDDPIPTTIGSGSDDGLTSGGSVTSGTSGSGTSGPSSSGSDDGLTRDGTESHSGPGGGTDSHSGPGSGGSASPTPQPMPTPDD